MMRSGVIAHTYNPSTREAKQEDSRIYYMRK